MFPCIAPALALDKREHIWSLCTLRAGSPPSEPDRQTHNTLCNLQRTYSLRGDVWHQFPLWVRKKGAQHVRCQLFPFDTPSFASVFVIRNNDIARLDHSSHLELQVLPLFRCLWRRAHLQPLHARMQAKELRSIWDTRVEAPSVPQSAKDLAIHGARRPTRKSPRQGACSQRSHLCHRPQLLR